MNKIIGVTVGTPLSASSVANAIKGKESGEVVALTDVSPLEHEMAVKASQGGVQVQRVGKNLVDVNAMLNSVLTKDENGVYRMRKDGDSLVSSSYRFTTPIPANTSFVLSYKNLEGYNANSNALLSHSIYLADGSTSSGNWVGGKWKDGNAFDSKLVLKKEKPVTGFLIKINNPSSDFWCSFSGLQIEIGETETEYEPYKEPITYTADENGNVNGVTSLYPTTTLLTDTEGVTIEAEYNVDTKKYIDKKFAELQALVLEV